MPQGWWESVENVPRGTMFLIGHSRAYIDIVGESFHQRELEAIAGPKTEEGCDFGCFAVMVHQDNNTHDPQAIAIGIGGYLVGHLSRQNAKQFREMMKPYGPVPALCRATIVGGWDRGRRDQGYFGVRLNIRWPIRVRWKKGEAP